MTDSVLVYVLSVLYKTDFNLKKSLITKIKV